MTEIKSTRKRKLKGGVKDYIYIKYKCNKCKTTHTRPGDNVLRTPVGDDFWKGFHDNEKI
jgi:hypothetical protein